MLDAMEAAAERLYDEMYVDEDHYKCSCGAITSNSEMNFLFPNPYAPPSCDECFEKYMKGEEK